MCVCTQLWVCVCVCVYVCVCSVSRGLYFNTHKHTHTHNELDVICINTRHYTLHTPYTTHCNTLEHTATHCNTLQHSSLHTPHTSAHQTKLQVTVSLILQTQLCVCVVVCVCACVCVFSRVVFMVTGMYVCIVYIHIYTSYRGLYADRSVSVDSLCVSLFFICLILQT